MAAGVIEVVVEAGKEREQGETIAKGRRGRPLKRPFGVKYLYAVE